jgi:signal transduction histidine kinase
MSGGGVNSVNQQDLDAGTLSEVSRQMLAVRDIVLQQWVQKLRATIAPAKSVRSPILIDSIPAFYENIARSLTPDYPLPTDSTAIAHEHGGERARLTCYDPVAVITEFQLFRDTVFDVLQANAVALTHRESSIIHSAIDLALKEAVNTFSLVRAALRERYSAALTHDLRNPLHAARVTAELLQRIDDPARSRELAAKIVANLTRMDEMIQTLLDSMLVESGERLQLNLRSFDMLQVICEVCEECTLRHGPRFRVHGGSVIGWWDREAVKRALENVLSNAVKYSYPDTLVNITIEETCGRLMLSVHNEGEPIPPEEQEEIFQIFRRAASAKRGDARGWGIGLPYVRGVAESHSGSIVVESTRDRGTIFRIDIPVDVRALQGAPTLAMPQ